MHTPDIHELRPIFNSCEVLGEISEIHIFLSKCLKLSKQANKMFRE